MASSPTAVPVLPRRRLAITKDYITVESVSDPQWCLAISRREGTPSVQLRDVRGASAARAAAPQ